MITTCLHAGEQNVPLQNKELQSLLEEVRVVTKTDWQVTERTHTTKRWFRKPVTVTLYSVYYPCGGCMPWQMINLYRPNGKMSLLFPDEILAAYLMGLLNGAVLSEITQ